MTHDLTQAAREARDALVPLADLAATIPAVASPYESLGQWGSLVMVHQVRMLPAILARLDAALASGDAEPVAIKPLEWTGPQALSPLGDLYVVTNLLGYAWQIRWNGAGVDGAYPSEAEAKAAVQADYEARIRSCLAAAPAKEMRP